MCNEKASTNKKNYLSKTRRKPSKGTKSPSALPISNLTSANGKTAKKNVNLPPSGKAEAD